MIYCTILITFQNFMILVVYSFIIFIIVILTERRLKSTLYGIVARSCYFPRNRARFQKGFLVVWVNEQNMRQNVAYFSMLYSANTNDTNNVFFGNTYMKSLFEEQNSSKHTRTTFLNCCTHVIQVSIEMKRAFVESLVLVTITNLEKCVESKDRPSLE